MNKARSIAAAAGAFFALGSFGRAAGWSSVGAVTAVETTPGGVEITAGESKIRVTAFRDGIFRVRVAPHGGFPLDRSWALAESALPPRLSIEDGPDAVRLTAGGISAVATKSPFSIRFENAAGEVLLADEPSRPMAWNGRSVRVWKTMPSGEAYFGLGDKAGPMNRRGRVFSLWNTDAFSWQESTDPLYKSIPFFLGLREGRAYGIFFDDAFRSTFDFGVETQNVLAFGADGGDIDYYFLAGPEPKKVVAEFASLTGRTPLPPLWTLGYQQCRWSYSPEARVREVARTFREKKIPADAIYLDIDYQDRNRPFTVSRGAFPHFVGMIRDLAAQGFHTIAITDLHVARAPNQGYAPYDSGMNVDAFVKNPDGSVYVGPVWPGDAVFPDFTLSRVRDWWGGLYKEFVGMGLAGFWNDMNEPSVFNEMKTMPSDVVHRLDDGTLVDHRGIHNVFGALNARATYEGLRRLKPGERPFVLTRAAFAGAQRWAASWTGDNSGTWNHLAMSTPQLLSLGLSGYGFVGDDIGGFAGSAPPDLLTRWMELGAFNPVFRGHAAKGTRDREPWVDGPQHEAIRRRAIERRYALLPYIYTAAEEMSRAGIPMMRPLFLEFPQASELVADERDFLLGGDLLVAPAFSEKQEDEILLLPPGGWYDEHSSTVHESSVTLHPALAELPVFVRAGAIVPEQAVVQNTGETPRGPLELRVYPGPDCRGVLYQDDGHTFAFEKGTFVRVRYSCEISAHGVAVSAVPEHDRFAPWWREARVTIYGVSASPREVRVRDRAVKTWSYEAETRTLSVVVPAAHGAWRVEIHE